MASPPFHPVMGGPHGGWFPGQTLMLSWRSVRGKGQAEQADIEARARVPLWFVIIGVLLSAGIVYSLLF